VCLLLLLVLLPLEELLLLLLLQLLLRCAEQLQQSPSRNSTRQPRASESLRL
jgi:hypothetical protein